jgi:hypothetical protein
MRAAAVGQDLIFISESLGSGTVLEPNTDDPPIQKFIYRDTDIPVISYEAFMFDDAEWTSHPIPVANDFSFFGNTGRTDQAAEGFCCPELLGGRDSLFIRKPDHPIAGGLTGKVKVFNTPYSLNYGKPSADADVIASVQENGDFPTLFVYDKGDKLVDGSVCPNKRIALYLGQVASQDANWNPEIRWLTDEGKTLILNTVAYALGSTNTPPVGGAATISIARSANDAVITFTGTLEAADAVTGAWAAVAGATSPRTVPLSSATAKFYRSKQ